MIAIYDSGIGGLSIYKALRKKLPYHDMMYLADQAYFPYGVKSADLIKKRAHSICTFFEKNNAELIVVACNTASVYALEWLRKKHSHLPIIGVVPVIKTCAERTKTNRIGVVSTPKTAASSYQKRLIKKFAPDAKIFIAPCPSLVEAVENGQEITHNNELVRIIQSFKKENIDVLALGCTHFPLVKNYIQKLSGKNILVLDSSDAVARQAARIVRAEQIKKGSAQAIFFSTGDTLKLQAALKKYLKINKRVKLLSI